MPAPLPGSGLGEEDFEEATEALAWEKAYKALQACREACLEAFEEAKAGCQGIDNEKTSKAFWEEKADGLTDALEKACFAHCQALQALDEVFAPKAETETPAQTYQTQATSETH